MIIDRIKSLCIRHDVSFDSKLSAGEMMDKLDKTVGFDTTGGHHEQGFHGVRCANAVGVRVLLHENRLDTSVKSDCGCGTLYTCDCKPSAVAEAMAGPEIPARGSHYGHFWGYEEGGEG